MSNLTCHNRRRLTMLGVLLMLALAQSFSVPSLHHHTFGSRQSTALHARRGRNNRNNFRRRVEEQKPPMNNEIKDPELRVMAASTGGEKDQPLGIMKREDALAKAKELGGLDLILINANSDPPVCKIVDYSKYRYMKEKKAKEVKKNSKASEIKEVKMSYKIDVHDYEVRKKNASKFLNQGNRVKCTVMFRGREVQHDKLGYELLDKLTLDLDKLALRENKPKREGRNLACILSPRPEVVKAVTDGKRAEEKAKKMKKEKAYKERQEALAAAEEQTAVATAERVTKSEVQEDDLLSALAMDADDDGDSLDALLGSDDLTENLFS